MNAFKSILLRLFLALRVDRAAERLASAMAQVRVARLRAHGIPLNFVPQGGYGFEIAGNLSRFQFEPSSHIKSDTFIECSGGVTIGRFFHTGRGLTIFSTSHNYLSGEFIPYDDVDIHRPVVIEDFVWCGANVTILPGVRIGEGAVIGAGSVVTRDIPPFSVAAGNPAIVVKHRDAERFLELKRQRRFK